MLQEEQDSSTVLPFPGKIVYPSCLGPVVELYTGSYLQSSVLFITSFRLAYAPARTRLSKLGLETGLRLVSLRHYLGLLHGDFCLR